MNILKSEKYGFKKISRTSYTIIMAVIAIISLLLFKYLSDDGDFDVYWAASFRFLHGLKIHIQEQNIFTYPTFASFLLIPIYPFGYSTAKVLYFILNVIVLFSAINICQRELLREGSLKVTILVISLICCSRSILSVFNNQQTDILIFGIIIYALSRFLTRPNTFCLLLGLAVGLKANPLFMILLPIFKKKWRMLITLFPIIIIIVVAPDFLKYAVNQSWDNPEFLVKSSVLPKDGIVRNTQFKAQKSEYSPLSYLKEHYLITMDVSPTAVRWWQDRGSKGNQSLYRIIASYVGSSVPSNYVFLGLCLAFSSLLLLASVRRNDSLFILGLLFYTAFILIGPQSSKAHFISFFGLFLVSWQYTLESKSVTRIFFLTSISIIFGISGVGKILPIDYIKGDVVGLSAFVLWLYVYYLFMTVKKEK